MEIYLVYNPRSGSSLSAHELRDKCKAAGLTLKKLIAINDELGKNLRKPIADGAVIAVIGGDGTINSIATKLVGTQATLAALPGGTFNHFTKDAGIPQDIDEALKRLGSAKARLVDTIRLGELTILNNSSLGLYPNSLRVRSRVEDRFGKFPAMIVGMWRTLFNFHAYRLEINGTQYVTPFVFIGNNRYELNDFGVTDRKKLDGGELCVFLAKAHTRRDLAKLFWAALRGKLHDANEFEIFHFKQPVKIESSRQRMNVSYDGEVARMQTPLTYELQPKSLRIL